MSRSRSVVDRGHRLWLWTGATLTGFALVVAAAVVAVGQGPDEFGTPPTRGGAVTPAAPSTPSSVERLPERLVLPSLGASAAVDPVPVRADGALAVPPDPRRVGWWAGGSYPGATRGTTLVAGHVDDVRIGPGAFYRLASLRAGDPVYLDTAVGRYAYRVVARRDHPRRRLPTNLVDRHGPARLVLVTCGGSFDPVRGYADNVVIYAVPSPGGPDRSGSGARAPAGPR